jgi:hypothetical protein
MRKLIFSLGKDVDVEELTLDGMDVNFEKKLHTSNLHDVLSKLSGGTEEESAAGELHDGREAKEACSGAPQALVEGVGAVSGAVSQAYGAVRHALGAEDGDQRGREVTLHKVFIKNVGTKISAKGFGPRIQVADISYDDFQAEVGARRGVVEAVHLLLATVIKSVLASVLGKDAASKAKKAIEEPKRRLDKHISEARGAVKALVGAGSDERA